MRPALPLLCLTALALASCKPPPTDADMDRDAPREELDFASEPLPSPDTENAIWARPAPGVQRLIYGNPGEPALVSLECVGYASELPILRVTRLSPADEGASALLAIVGNGHIGRIEVEAREVNGRTVWQGESEAADLAWEPLAGPRQMTLTVPGAGMVTLNPSDMPGELLEFCRFGPEQVQGPPIDEADRERLCAITDCRDRPSTTP